MLSDSGDEKFKCLTYDHLTSYLDGTLEPGTLESCERHLASCNRCSLAREMLEELLSDEVTQEEIRLIEMVGPGRPLKLGRRGLCATIRSIFARLLRR